MYSFTMLVVAVTIVKATMLVSFVAVIAVTTTITMVNLNSDFMLIAV